MIALDELWNRSLKPDLYHLSARRYPDRLFSEASEHGFRCFLIDGRKAGDKKAFLQTCSEAIQAPQTADQTWQSLAANLVDLSWAPSSAYLLFFDRAEIIAADHPDDWKEAKKILVDTVSTWHARNIPFYVFLRGSVATIGLNRYPRTAS
ncbi:barstar family protein [Chloroflexia bacterium SDU3-3]|nr:barstar family protein [Chloroflexia bacterium SDU3-3]